MKIRIANFHVLALVLGVASTAASAQVASHGPVIIESPGNLTTAPPSQPVGRPVVRVNGTMLTDRDLLREMYAIFPYARVHNGFPKGMEEGIREGALKMMIFEELVYQQAGHVNMTVPPAELARAMAEFRQQFHSPKQFQQFLQSEFDGSQAMLQTKVERSLLIDKFLKREVKDKAVVSVAEAKAYFNQHPQSFHMPESFSFQSISILPPANATAAQLQEAKKRASDALRHAQATKTYEEFGALAERTSEDDFRVMMGDHQPADRSKLPPQVVKALLALQPGQVSDLIEFDVNNYTILRLKSHSPAGLPKFEAIKDALRQKLTKDKNEQLRSALSAKLSKNAKIEKV